MSLSEDATRQYPTSYAHPTRPSNKPVHLTLDASSKVS